MTQPTPPAVPWTQRQAREGLGDTRRLLLVHTARTADWEGEPLTYCVRCSPREQDHKLEAVKWPCPPLLEAGLTIRDAGMLDTGADMGRESTRDEREKLRRWQTMMIDLDRCPHGRHAGDQCAGWRGPGRFDGGCQGGYSLGNPALHPAQVIGTNLYADRLYIVAISRETRHDIDAWSIPITDGRLLDAYAADETETELVGLRNALRDANRALYAAGIGPFLPGQGQLPYPTTAGPLPHAGELTEPCPGSCPDGGPHDAHLLPGALDVLAGEGANGARLGLATTRRLLIELQARGDGTATMLYEGATGLLARLDEEILNYRTVDGG